jgi:hypothetical protein
MIAWDHLFVGTKGDTSVKGYVIVPYIQGVIEPIK